MHPSSPRIFGKLIFLCCFGFQYSGFAKQIPKNLLDTGRKKLVSNYEKLSPLIQAGKIPFYGTWADYFSSYLTIDQDSGFKYVWGFSGKNCHTEGRWQRVQDTFYFRPGILYQTDKNKCPLPEKLCYYNNRLYHLDSSGKRMRGKIPSLYMGKKSPLFKTLYYRDARYNAKYFDSAYYNRLSGHTLRFGTGINNMFQPVAGYSMVYSFGFSASFRYLFQRKENTYLSLGIPLTLGFSGANDSLSTEPHLGVMVDLPLIFNYNYKFGSLKNHGSRFEYFVGGGVAYHLNNFRVSQDPSVPHQTTNGFGPLANAGIRYYISKYRVKNFELKFSYMKMIVENSPDIFGFGLLVNF